MLAFGARIEKNGWMRGSPDPQLAMLTTLSTEELIPKDHPIRRIRVMVDTVLAQLDPVHRMSTPNDAPGQSEVAPNGM